MTCKNTVKFISYHVSDINRKAFDLEIFESINYENGLVTLIYNNGREGIKFNIINLALKLDSMFIHSKHKVSSVFKGFKKVTDVSNYTASKLFIFEEAGVEKYMIVTINNRLGYGYSAFYTKKDISKYKNVFLEKLPSNIFTINLPQIT